ncbi:MAG: hypothetical protein CTY18_06000 [Methylomonas sp.]|nr:MAG: hypothetical protein CTY18_06000 [Methylomonas sp.]
MPDAGTCKLNNVRNFVRAKRPFAECFYLRGKFEVTDDQTAEDIGFGNDEISAWTDAAVKMGYNAELSGAKHPLE